MKKSLIALSFFLVFGSTQGLAQSKAQQGNNLIIGRGVDSVTLDPARSDDLESSNVIENIFEGLVRYRDDSTVVEPCLATSWESSPDQLEWKFQLRKDVLFHDGTPFNAQAVVFSFLRQIDPHHPFYRNDFSYAPFTFQYVKKVEALDEYAVKITLEKPYAPFLQNMAMTSTCIVSPAALAKWGNDFYKHPVGTGPFKFVEWVPGDRIIMERNETYWHEPPFIGKLIFKSIPNTPDRLLELKTSAIHVMDGISPEITNQIARDGELRLDIRPGVNVAYVAMNTEKKPFDQVQVRQAINHAINKQNLVRFLYRDLAIPAVNPIPPTLWGYADGIEDYAFNPQHARTLLKEAGYESGFDTTLWVMSAPRPYLPRPEEAAKAIHANLAAVGIRAKIVSLDWETYLDKTSNGEHEMCLIGWVGDNGDPDNFLYVLLDQDNAVKPIAENLSFFKNDQVHELLLKAQQISDQKERAGIYQKAQQIIHQQAPWVPLAHVQQVVAYRGTVHGATLHPTGIIRLKKAWRE